MSERLCVSERRIRILNLLRINRQMTRCDLAHEFNVSTRTISRDILYLSHIAPITIKDGNGGGVYLKTDFRQYSLYLTDKEEDCLYAIMDNLNAEYKDTVKCIIAKFTKNTAFTNQSI
ncbi:MAG: HTH domain-containing protein [Eubacterium sp.]|nr:HTH domain-containing protein [Clostridia bacterium]MCI8956149.1 HTH domain-containing protein [Eubacterium sp.]